MSFPTIAKQPLSILLSSLLLLSALFLSGCATKSRTIEKPIEGSYRTSISSYKKEANGYSLIYRTTSDTHAYFGFIQNYKTPVNKSNQVKSYYLSGADRECPEVVMASLGILLPIDFLIWVVQFGSNDSMCFAQLYDTSPSTTWSKEFATGQYYEFTEPYTGSMKFSYKEKFIPAESNGGGVWSIRMADLPKGVDIHNVILRSQVLYFQ